MSYDPIEAFERSGSTKRRWMIFALGLVLGVGCGLLALAIL